MNIKTIVVFLVLVVGTAVGLLSIGGGSSDGEVLHRTEIRVHTIRVPVYRTVREVKYVPMDSRAYRQKEVYYGMMGLASTEAPYSLDKLMRRWGKRPSFGWKLAGWFVEIGDEYGLDPFDLLTLTWRESRWNTLAVGDCGCYVDETRKRGTNKASCAGEGGRWLCVSCGIMQANMGVDGRKWGMTCHEAKIRPRKLIDRGASVLASYRNERGQLDLWRYNCPRCRKVTKYETQIRRTSEMARTKSRQLMILDETASTAFDLVSLPDTIL